MQDVLSRINEKTGECHLDLPNGHYIHSNLSVFIDKRMLREMLDKVGGEDVCMVGIDNITSSTGDVQYVMFKVGRCVPSKVNDLPAVEVISGTPDSNHMAMIVQACDTEVHAFDVVDSEIRGHANQNPGHTSLPN